MTRPRTLTLIFVLVAGLLSPLHARTLINAAEHGLTPGEQEAGPALRTLLQRAQESGKPCTVQLAPGEYHFHAENAVPYQFYVSNHDQQPEHRVGIPLVGLKDVCLKGENVRFVFHGKMLPVLVMDSRNTQLEGFSIRYATPFSAEGRIVEQEGNRTILEMTPGARWAVENGRFHNIGDGWKDKVCAAIAFKDDGRMVPLGKPGDIVWNARAVLVSPTRVSFMVNSRALGLSVGDVLVLRSYWRPAPAMLLYRATNTSLRDVVFHDSMGMALLAQRSENIRVKGGGCVRLPGRYGTTAADATHFSNCKGSIQVREALYEGMMDDAINVHATCLGITSVISPTEIEARYMHHQAIGFEVVRPGERVTFIHGPTLENHPKPGTVAAVEVLDARRLRIRFEKPLPEGIGAGDALENTDWHPAVSFCNNTVRHNRARGALFTTPKPVLVEGNRFIWSSGSAILLAGDAQGWYESGRCQDVTIRHNIFDHNLTCRFQFTDAIISICPEVKRPEEQKTRYHENIRIEHNTFRTHRVPLLSAISADKLIFRNNKVEYDDVAAPLHEGVPYRLRHCGKTRLQDIPQPGQKK